MTFSAKNRIVFIALAVALLMATMPWTGLSPLTAQSGAVVLFTLVLWATGALPPFLTSLIFFALVLIFGLAADLFNTWVTNAQGLRWYLSRPRKAARGQKR